jgi:hypothetical protein
VHVACWVLAVVNIGFANPLHFSSLQEYVQWLANVRNFVEK